MEWHSKLTDAKRTLYHLTTYRWPVVKVIAELRRRSAAAEAPPKPAASVAADPAAAVPVDAVV